MTWFMVILIVFMLFLALVFTLSATVCMTCVAKLMQLRVEEKEVKIENDKKAGELYDNM